MGLNEGDSVVAIATTNGKKPEATDDADDTDNSGEEVADTSEEEIIDNNAITEATES